MPSTVFETHSELALNRPSPTSGFARHINDLPVEGGTDPVVGDVTWKTLICSDRTQSSGILLGVAEFPANGVLNPHSSRAGRILFLHERLRDGHH